jgi:hypothetical protein
MRLVALVIAASALLAACRDGTGSEGIELGRVAGTTEGPLMTAIDAPANFTICYPLDDPRLYPETRIWFNPNFADASQPLLFSLRMHPRGAAPIRRERYPVLSPDTFSSDTGFDGVSAYRGTRQPVLLFLAQGSVKITSSTLDEIAGSFDFGARDSTSRVYRSTGRFRAIRDRRGCVGP